MPQTWGQSQDMTKHVSALFTIVACADALDALQAWVKKRIHLGASVRSPQFINAYDSDIEVCDIHWSAHFFACESPYLI